MLENQVGENLFPAVFSNGRLQQVEIEPYGWDKEIAYSMKYIVFIYMDSQSDLK